MLNSLSHIHALTQHRLKNITQALHPFQCIENMEVCHFKPLLYLVPLQWHRNRSARLRPAGIRRCNSSLIPVLQEIKVHLAPACPYISFEARKLRKLLMYQRNNDPGKLLALLIRIFCLQRYIDMNTRRTARFYIMVYPQRFQYLVRYLRRFYHLVKSILARVQVYDAPGRILRFF